LNNPKIRADFNGLFGEFLYLSLPVTGIAEEGSSTPLHTGMTITAFDEGADEHGKRDDIIATGTVVASPKWLQCNGSRGVLKIDANGVRQGSELRKEALLPIGL
jgi:hypothetical protein